MTKHATVYCLLCLVASTALLGHERTARAASGMQGTAAPGTLEERIAAIVKSEILAKGSPTAL